MKNNVWFALPHAGRTSRDYILFQKLLQILCEKESSVTRILILNCVTSLSAILDTALVFFGSAR